MYAAAFSAFAVWFPRNRGAGADPAEWLSPKQRACYERFRYFDVVGSDTGTRYRIHHGTQTNIEELSHTGQRVCKWCFVPEGDLVAGDVMLAQKIALETNERGALSVAHRSFVSMGPRR